MQNTISDKNKIWRWTAFAAIVAMAAVWLLFIVDLWNNCNIYIHRFPSIEYIQNFQSRLPGSSVSFQCYILSSGVPFAIFLMLVLLPEILKQIFPRYRVWNQVYIAVSSMVIILMTVLALSITDLYRGSEIVAKLSKGYVTTFIQKVTAWNVHLTMLLFLLIVICSLALMLLNISKTELEAKKRTICQMGWTIPLCLLIAIAKIIITSSMLNVLSVFNPNTVSGVYSFSVQNATYPMLAFVSIVCAPIMEEITFRGVLCNRLDKVSFRWCAIIISAAAFGLWHRNLGQFVYTFAAGVLYGYLYLVTKRLIYPMLVHFVNNLLGILAYSEMSTAVLGQHPVICAIRQWLTELPLVISILLFCICMASCVIILRHIKKIHTEVS